MYVRVVRVCILAYMHLSSTVPYLVNIIVSFNNHFAEELVHSNKFRRFRILWMFSGSDDNRTGGGTSDSHVRMWCKSPKHTIDMHLFTSSRLNWEKASKRLPC